MRLWKRASGVLKDQNSLWIAGLSKRTALRNPDIEAAVIKATSHDELRIDYRSFERVYTWLDLSDTNVMPLVRCMMGRMNNTRNWAVALKGLMLMHGVFATKVSVVRKIGRLPFDLSSFKDGHSKLGKTWCQNAFIRSYYAFLDQKSVLLHSNLKDQKGSRRTNEEPRFIMQEIEVLQKVQGLLDLLLQIKPQAKTATVFLLVEAMDGIVNEVFDIYSRMCKMIVSVLKKMDSAVKAEGKMILKVLQKAVNQGDELSQYFDLCREIGVASASTIPQVQRISEKDIQEIELMVNGMSEKSELMDELFPEPPEEQDKAIVIRPESQTGDQGDDSRSKLRTIITSNWEKFDEELLVKGETSFPASVTGHSTSELNTFLALPAPPQAHPHSRHQELQDLISFS